MEDFRKQNKKQTKKQTGGKELATEKGGPGADADFGEGEVVKIMELKMLLPQAGNVSDRMPRRQDAAASTARKSMCCGI